MRDLVHSAHFVVRVDDAQKLVERVRTSVRFSSIAEIHAEYGAVVRALDTLDRARHVSLIDLRASPSRNDPDYEQAVAQYHVALYRGFARNAVLVQTAAGKLQLLRIARDGHLTLEVFTDEAAARSWLVEGIPSRTPSRRPR